MSWDSPKMNYLREGGPLVIHAPTTRWVVWEPISINNTLGGVVLRGFVWLQWIFFWRPFQCVCPFHDGWFTSTVAHTVLSIQQFSSKYCMTPVPHVPNHLIFPLGDSFCFPGWKKSSKRCGRGETKNSRSTKRHQNPRVQKVFWAVEKSLNRCIASNWEYFEADWSLNTWE